MAIMVASKGRGGVVSKVRNRKKHDSKSKGDIIGRDTNIARRESKNDTVGYNAAITACEKGAAIDNTSRGGLATGFLRAISAWKGKARG